MRRGARTMATPARETMPQKSVASPAPPMASSSPRLQTNAIVPSVDRA